MIIDVYAFKQLNLSKCFLQRTIERCQICMLSPR